jgi:hypothetical protein
MAEKRKLRLPQDPSNERVVAAYVRTLRTMSLGRLLRNAPPVPPVPVTAEQRNMAKAEKAAVRAHGPRAEATYMAVQSGLLSSPGGHPNFGVPDDGDNHDDMMLPAPVTQAEARTERKRYLEDKYKRDELDRQRASREMVAAAQRSFGFLVNVLMDIEETCAICGDYRERQGPLVACTAHGPFSSPKLLCAKHDHEVHIVAACHSRCVLVRVDDAPRPVLRHLGADEFLRRPLPVDTGQDDDVGTGTGAAAHAPPVFDVAAQEGDIIRDSPVMPVVPEGPCACGCWRAEPQSLGRDAKDVLATGGAYKSVEATHLHCVRCLQIREVHAPEKAVASSLLSVSATGDKTFIERGLMDLMRHMDTTSFKSVAAEWLGRFVASVAGKAPAMFEFRGLLRRYLELHAMELPVLRGHTVPCFVCAEGVSQAWVDVNFKAYRFAAATGPQTERIMGPLDVVRPVEEMVALKEDLAETRTLLRGAEKECGDTTWKAAKDVGQKFQSKAVTGLLNITCPHLAAMTCFPITTGEDQMQHLVAYLVSKQLGAETVLLDCGCQFVRWVDRRVREDPGFANAMVRRLFPGNAGALLRVEEHNNILVQAVPTTAPAGNGAGQPAEAQPADAPHGPADAPHGPVDAPHGPADAPHGPADAPHGPADAPPDGADERRRDGRPWGTTLPLTSSAHVAIPVAHAYAHSLSCRQVYAAGVTPGAGVGVEKAEQANAGTSARASNARIMGQSAFHEHFSVYFATSNLNRTEDLPARLARSFTVALTKHTNAVVEFRIVRGNRREADLDAKLARRREVAAEGRAIPRHVRANEARKRFVAKRTLEAQAAALDQVLSTVHGVDPEKALPALLMAISASADAQAGVGRRVIKGVGDVEKAAAGARNKAAAMLGEMLDNDLYFEAQFAQLRARTASLRADVDKLAEIRATRGGLDAEGIYTQMQKNYRAAYHLLAELRAVQPLVSDAAVKAFALPADKDFSATTSLPTRLGGMVFEFEGEEFAAHQTAMDALAHLRRAREELERAAADAGKAHVHAQRVVADLTERLRLALSDGPAELQTIAGQSSLAGRNAEPSMWGDPADLAGRSRAVRDAFAHELYSARSGFERMLFQLDRLQLGVECVCLSLPSLPLRTDSMGRVLIQQRAWQLLSGAMDPETWAALSQPAENPGLVPGPGADGGVDGAEPVEEVNELEGQVAAADAEGYLQGIAHADALENDGDGEDEGGDVGGAEGDFDADLEGALPHGAGPVGAGAGPVGAGAGGGYHPGDGNPVDDDDDDDDGDV